MDASYALGYQTIGHYTRTTPMLDLAQFTNKVAIQFC